jgi:serine/threonine protein kinase/Tol biopolymer transport system component
MAWSSGTRLGVYEIVAAVGAGGMGEVYRARDTRLQRDVAIKVLPDLFVRDPERLARFEREARTLAALNDPHIAQVYGTVDLPAEGAGRGTTGLVMELVQGDDLSQRIARGALPLDEALPIALQIADALRAAHDQGIVHRDLKPANIKVRGDGTVKVLDFGLAKALDAPAADGPPGLRTEDSPTITSPFQMSRLGVILGTAAYMAPEQAKGKAVDKRADIWAFGCVLYEMLTGAPAFPGDDITDTLAAIVRAEPDWAALPAATPRAIRTLLRRCLQKDRSERLPDIGAARLELKEVRTEDAAAPTSAVTARHRRVMLPWLLFAASALAAIAILGYAYATWRAPDVAVYKAMIIPPGSLSGGAPVRRLQISPDGQRLAFAARDASGQTSLWVRALNDLQAQSLAGTAGAAAPFWSPDSRWIAFQAGGKLKKVEATGGSVSTICATGDSPPGTWNRDGVILLTGAGNVVFRVPAAGGTRVPVTKLRPETGDRIHISPFFLPDGRHFLYSSGTGGAIASSVYVGSLDSDNATLLLNGTAAQYANGYVVFLRGSTLMAQRFDAERLALSGEAAAIAQDVQINATTGTGAFSISQNGVLVFQSGSSVGLRLTWMDRSGRVLGYIGDAASYADVQMSPDRKWVSVTKAETSGRTEIWLIDVARKLPRRLTFDAAGGFDAVWAPPPAGRLAYASRREKVSDLFQMSVDGGDEEQVLLRDGTEKQPVGFSPDGKYLVYSVPTGAARGRLWLLPLVDRKPREFLPGAPDQSTAEISPDGRWIAYVAIAEDSTRRVYVASFPDGSKKREISPDGGESPHWRSDGKELFFTNASHLMAVPTDTTGATMADDPPQPLFDVFVPAPQLGSRSTFAVSRDGQQFLFTTWDAAAAQTPITLVVNWPASLKRD